MEDSKLEFGSGDVSIHSTQDAGHSKEIKKEFLLSFEALLHDRLIQDAVVKYEDIVTQQAELQIKSEFPDTKCGILSNDDDIYIKIEPLVSEEVDIKDPKGFVLDNQHDLPNMHPVSEMFSAELHESIPTSVLHENEDFCRDDSNEFDPAAEKLSIIHVKRVVQEHAYAQPLVLQNRTEPLVTQILVQPTGDDCHSSVLKILENAIPDGSQLHVKPQAKEKHFRCNVCGYRCAWKGNLLKHMNIHTGEKPFKCSVCDYKSSRKSTLKEHLKIHSAEKPFNCSVCGYRCRRKDGLKVHVKIHTEKPLQCNVCGYRCACKNGLKQHLGIHTRKKPFKCSVCNYRANWRSNLNKHLKIHSGDKPFKRNVCGYRCRQSCSLKVYAQTHTG